MPLYKKCLVCNKEFLTYPYDEKVRKYCSFQCYWKAKKGSVGYWIGKNRSKETIEKIRQAKLGKPSKRKGKPSPKTANENHPFWKGDKVSYSGLHYWIVRKRGKPTTCEHCGKINLKGKFIHWANKSHKYKRDLEDWLRLCAECHKKYDKL